MNLANLLFLLTLLSCAFWLLACWCTRKFFQEGHPIQTSFTPPVSILKPVEGMDPQAETNYRSFCHQDYPEYELLFGMQDTAQPVLPVLERLKREFPDRHIQIVTAEPLGANAKVSNLHALAQASRYDILVLSDSDMRVTPDYLRQVVAPLHDESIGVVTCPYRGEQATTWAARFGALYFASTYMPAAIVGSRLFGFPVAFGSTMVLRRADLDRIGGFTVIKDHLADDYQLAARIAALGKRVILSPYIVKTILGAESWRQVWQREIRWMRCVRASRPLEYPGVLLWFSLPLSLAAAWAMGFDTVGRNLIVFTLLVRWGTSWLVAGYTGDSLTRWALPWLPLRDFMTFAVWCIGIVGRHVEWRGQRFRVLPDGRLATLKPTGAGQVQTWDVHHKGE